MKLFDLKISGFFIYAIAAIFLQSPSKLPAQTTEQAEQCSGNMKSKKEDKRSLEEQRNSIIQKEQDLDLALEYQNEYQPSEQPCSLTKGAGLKISGLFIYANFPSMKTSGAN